MSDKDAAEHHKMLEKLTKKQELFKTIHLGQKVLHFTTPQPIVDEINKIYDKNLKDLTKHNKHLAGKIEDEHKVDEHLPENIKMYFEQCFRMYTVECKVTKTINLRQAWINEMKANNEVDSPEFRDNMQKLEKVLGVDQINPFGTNELDIFEEKLKGMSKSDLQDLAYKVGLNPYQAQGSIKQNLTNEFKAYNRNNMRNIMPQSSTVQKLDPDNPQHAKTIKILGDI